ncbi:hypothetical protein FQK07_14125 [Synechococcus sp. BSF8S]|nr:MULTISPECIES: hypothetical protein [unclassified Synechococcus]MBC1262368.1 hypothetical protein [Synechococcus sp. BSF8S]MBC1265271.1 hypothetical protein [Synechococcus sp. BSA11S]
MDDAAREHWERIADEVFDRALQRAEANAPKANGSAHEVTVTDARFARLAELQAQLEVILRELSRLEPGSIEHETAVLLRYEPALRDALALGDELSDEPGEP